jgi:hypothetical protein
MHEILFIQNVDILVTVQQVGHVVQSQQLFLQLPLHLVNVEVMVGMVQYIVQLVILVIHEILLMHNVD